MSAPQAEFHFSPRPNRAHEIGWRPWSEAAFADAQAEDRPILLSISAVWCHWCHVMDETTYSDPAVIETINRLYVPVRVDNDLRPDINQRYNLGGWPTTAFLTPAGDILTGATYLPPEQMRDSLVRVAEFYREHQPEIRARLEEARQQVGSRPAPARTGPALADRILGAVEGAYDPVHGGFGSAPKFPHPDAILLLLEQRALRREPRLRDMAVTSLRAMAGGGTYDQVEGGFFRYSTTADWSVPHFEKMLEDHAALVAALAVAEEAEILDRTVAYLDRVLRDPATGLYGGSQDADEDYYALDAEGRGSRTPPSVDRRVYSGWNCALAVAWLEADRRLGRPQLRTEAAQLLESLFVRRWEDDLGLAHADGVEGQLGDQVWALLAACRASSAGLGPDWLSRAERLAALLDQRYADPEAGGYFDTSGGEALGRLGERLQPLAENSVAAMGLVELDALLSQPGEPYRRRAEAVLAAVAGQAPQQGLLAAVFARALDRLQKAPVKVTTSHPGLIRAALTSNPYAVIAPGDAGQAVVCIGTECLAPSGEADRVAAAAAPRQASFA